MAIVREKEVGTMEQLMVSPIRPMELMLGKTLPFAVIGLVDMMLVVAAAVLMFRVPFRGSGLLLFAASTLFLLTSLGAGLFISTISRTQQQAMMTTFLFFQPFFLLSGFAFPIRNMPELDPAADVFKSSALLHGNRARDLSCGAAGLTCCGRRCSRWLCLACQF